MPIRYTFAPARDFKSGQTGHRVMAVRRDTLGAEELAQIIADGTTLDPGEAALVLRRLSGAIRKALLAGDGVEIPGFASVGPRLTSGMVDPATFDASGLSGAQVSVRVAKVMREALRGARFVAA